MGRRRSIAALDGEARLTDTHGMPHATAILGEGDEERLLAFLERHPNTTMFLRGNLGRAGIVDRGQRFGGFYAAALDGTKVVGAVAHFWNGNLAVEAPDGLEEVVRAVVAASGRPVNGVLGSWGQMQTVLHTLGLEAETAVYASREALFALALSELQAPALLDRSDVHCRPPRADDLERLVPWSAAYNVETLGSSPGPELTERVRTGLTEMHKAGTHWVLEVTGDIVAYGAFNATLPDCVQIGGVFTPPELRGRGYARAVVAGSLIEARSKGTLRSVLFTGEHNTPAQSAYRALGFQRVGDYGITLFV
jgi:GNAT superfamily N-acetyltransferase